LIGFERAAREFGVLRIVNLGCGDHKFSREEPESLRILPPKG
jgi:hypothetical protein